METEPKSIKYYNGTDIAINFIQYFYQVWTSNPAMLIDEQIIKPFSKLRYNNTTFEGIQFVETLASFMTEGFHFSDCKFEILDSGSRQIYILATGSIGNEMLCHKFSQTFILSYAGESKTQKWMLINSLLSIDFI